MAIRRTPRSTLHALRSPTSPRSGASGHPAYSAMRSIAGRLAADVALPAPRAFTILEVLVAMSVLAILILMSANIFQSASAAWNIGTQKSDMNNSARAALDFMARELQCAVAGPVEAAATPTYAPSLEVIAGNEIHFVSLIGDVHQGRALRNGAFYHRPASNDLMYAHQLAIPYEQLPSQLGAHMLVDNVLNLQFFVFTNETALTNGNWALPMTHNELPYCIDIALEMMSDDDMEKYNALTGAADRQAFEERNSKLYTTRVYFPNRKGYQAR